MAEDKMNKLLKFSVQTLSITVIYSLRKYKLSRVKNAKLKRLGLERERKLDDLKFNCNNPASMGMIA